MLSFKEYLVLQESNPKNESLMRNLALAGIAGAGMMGNPANAGVNWKSPEHQVTASQFDTEMDKKLAHKEEAMKKYGLNEKDWQNLSPKDRIRLLAMTRLGDNHPIVKHLNRKDAMPFGWQ